jgi:16S rRNA (uracil1498-N3)-methyltransferase
MPTLHRVYCSLKERLTCNSIIQLPKSQSLHVTTVLRLSKGDKLVIFNEYDGSFLATIEEAKSLCSVILEKFLNNAEKLRPFIVGIPLIKKHRFSTMLESVTQLGATKIVPIRFDRGQIFDLKDDKMLKQVISSVEQCGRHTVPEISKALTLQEFIDLHIFIVCANEKSSISLNAISDLIVNSSSIALLVGPEGGFSEDEQKLLSSSSNIQNVGLGPLILRSETAISCLASQIKLFYS